MALKTCQAKYATTAFNSKWKHEKLVVVVHVPRITHNLVILRCCFAEDSKEMHRFITHVLSYCYNKQQQQQTTLNLLFSVVLVAVIIMVRLGLVHTLT